MSGGTFSSVVAAVAAVATTSACGYVGRVLSRHHKDHTDTRDHLSRQDTRLGRIEAEFYPNGGESARDVLDDVMRAVESLARQQDVQLPPRRSRPKRGECP